LSFIFETFIKTNHFTSGFAGRRSLGRKYIQKLAEYLEINEGVCELFVGIFHC